MPIAENSPVQVLMPGALLVSERGQPVPPQDVVRELWKINLGLSIEWVQGAFGTSCFGLFERWRQDDVRWERVRRGEYPEHLARDLVTRFPPECPTREMVSWVRARWGDRAVTDPRAEAERLMAEAQRLMAQAQQEHEDRLVATVEQQHADESDHARAVHVGAASAHPMVPGGLTKDEPRRLL